MKLFNGTARYALFLIAYYVTNSIYQGFLTLYYQNTLGFSSTQIGAILAGVAIVSIIAQPFWGSVGDRSKSLNRVIRILCVLASVSILSILLVKDFIPVLVLVCVFACFYMSIQPLGDSIILGALRRQNKPFGLIRLAGGLSFAVASLVFGRIINQPGREVWAVYFTAGLAIVTLFATFALPETRGQQSAGGRKMSFAALFKMKDLMLLMVFMIIIQITMGYFYAFFSVHYTSLEGADSSLLGWCYFISACSEIPYLLNSDRLFKKIGAGRLMCISALTLTARWLIVGLSDNYIVVLLSQLLHGWGFIVMTVSMAKYVSLTVPRELQASGQMLLAVGSFGISRAIGNLGGGLLADAMGRQTVFLICAGVCFIALIAFAPYYLRHAPLNGDKKFSID